MYGKRSIHPMLKQTLKQRHQFKQFNENVKKADKTLLRENKHAKLLIESMNDEDLQKASKIIDKLRSIKGKGVEALDNAIAQAETQINKYTAGGPLVKAWSKLKNVAGFDNPLVKFMTFSNALETGFKQLPTIIKNNVTADLQSNQDETLAKLVTEPEKQKILANNMLKALSPQGIFSAFKKVPYVKREELVQNLMNVPIKTLVLLSKQIASGPNSEQIAGDLKSVASSQGSVENKGTQNSTPAQGSSGTIGTSTTKQPTQTAGTSKTGETPPRESTKIVDAVYKQLNNALIDAVGNEQRAKAVLKLLADEDMLKL